MRTKSKIFIYISDDEAQDVFDRIEPRLTETGKDMGDLHEADDNHPHPYYEVEIETGNKVDKKFRAVVESNGVTMYGSVPSYVVELDQTSGELKTDTVKWFSERQVDLLL